MDHRHLDKFGFDEVVEGGELLTRPAQTMVYPVKLVNDSALRFVGINRYLARVKRLLPNCLERASGTH